MHKHLITSVTLGAAVATTAGLASAANITDLDPAAALVSYSNGDATTYDITPSGTIGEYRGRGYTFNATITPTAEDLTGTSLITEYGGTANGVALVLVDGVLTHSAKHNSSDLFAPDSLNDLELRPGGTGRGEIAVQSAFGPLTAGTTYSLAVSWDQAGNLQLGVQDDTTGSAENFLITGGAGNWSGNNSVGIGAIYSSAGGLGGELTDDPNTPDIADDPVRVPDPWDVDQTPVNPFAGTISDLHFWNAAGNITVVPEPASASLLGLAGLTLLRRRRA